MYYYVRNRFSILKSKFSNNLSLALIMYFGFLIAFAGTVIVFQRTNKLRKLGFILWPMTDAFANNFKATPASVMERISVPVSYGPLGFIYQHVKLLRGTVRRISSASADN